MKFTIERTQILRALGSLQSVVERRNTIPILANILLDADKGRVALTATDMDLSVVETLPAEIGAAGRTTLPAHTLYEIVRKLPEGSQIAFESGDGRVNLRAGRSRFALPSLPAEDFPALGTAALPHNFRLPAADLRRLIDRTRFAISTEETRYYLNGIYLHVTAAGKEPVLRAVATDGHRLARFELSQPQGAGGMPGVIVPRKAVAELRKLIEDSDEAIQISLSDVSIRFSFDAVVLSSKLIDGTFPDYERVIPSGNNKLLEVDCRSFADAVDRVATISTERARAVKISLGQGNVTVSASSPENGTAAEELEVRYDAAPMEIGFNARYLLDIAQQIEGEGAQFALADSASPTLVRDVGNPNALYVLMPMRV